MRVVLRDDESDEAARLEFERLLDESEKREESGQVKTCRIVSINEDGASVDVGGKTEGFLPLSEISKDGQLIVGVGDNIEVFVSNGRRGEPVVSHKKALRVARILEKINELGEDFKDKIIEGKIIHKNKGGFIVESQGIEYFMPKYASAIKDPNKMLNKIIKACVIEVRPKEYSIIVSRKRFFDINDAKQADGIKKILENKDTIYNGIIKGIANYGIFVEVEGINGFVHCSEISYKGYINPYKYYKEGDSVQLKVLDYDAQKKSLSFSIKAIKEDPWKEIQNELKKGYAIKVVVSNIESYGAFVDIGNDIEGFLHISEISWNKDVKHPSSHLKIGQEIDVEVIEIDTENRRLRVSLKNLLQKPFEQFAKSYKNGDVVKGKIATLTDFGAFVTIGEVDGLLNNNDAFWEKGQKCKDKFKVGDEIEVKIINIDAENKRISLNTKELQESPTERFSKHHKVDDIIKGKVSDIKDFGVFIEIDGMDALIRNEDLHPLKKEDIKVGDEIEGVLITIDKKYNHIRVSVKRLEKQQEREQLKAFNSVDNKMTLGDILKDKL